MLSQPNSTAAGVSGTSQQSMGSPWGPVTQHVDDATRVYLQIIEDTLAASKGLQNPRVLEQVKQKWIANLQERIASQQQLPPRGAARGIHPVRGDRAPRADSLKGVTIRTGDDATATPPVKLAKRETSAFDLSQSSELTRLPGVPTADPDDIVRGALADRVKQQQESFRIKAEEAAVPPVFGAAVVAPSRVEEEEEEEEEEEDGWEEWETPEHAAVSAAGAEGIRRDEEESVKKKKVAPPPPQRELASPTTGRPEIDESTGQVLPTAQDFATKIRAQYGRTGAAARELTTEGMAAPGSTETAGSSATQTSWNALVWENPDEVDSDLDNVSDLSDDEPEARDIVVGQIDMMQKPAGRKATSVGLWKVRLRNGIAKIDSQEFFFDTFYAELEYCH